jgi:hypothetical protein
VLHIGLFNNEFVAAYSKDISDGKLKIGLLSEINKELGVCFNDIIIYTKEDGYPNDRNEIKSINNTNDETLHPIFISDMDNTFDGWSEAKLYCHKVYVSDDGVVTFVVPYVDTKIIDAIDNLGQANINAQAQIDYLAMMSDIEM